MSYRMRLLVVLLTFYLAPPVGAEDKPPAKPGEGRRAALVKAGYTHVPLSLKTTGPVPAALYLNSFVDGAVGSEKVKFFLDSGLGYTFLDLNLARRMKMKLSEEVATTGVGPGLFSRRMEVPGLMIGPYDTRKDLPVLPAQAVDLSGWTGAPGGVLGMQLLDPCAAVIDFPARSLYLRPPLTTAWPRLAGIWTVTNWHEDGVARKLDPNTPPTFTFADRRLKLTDGGTTREFAIRFGPNDAGDFLLLIDPKRDGDPDPVVVAGGRIKLTSGAMTACLCLENDKPRDLPIAFAAPKGSGYVLLELKCTAPDAQKPPADPLRDLLLKDGYTALRLEREPDGLRIAAASVGRHDLRLVVDTGATVSTFDTAGLDKWGAERLGAVDVDGLGGKVKGETISLRGLMLGGYDTRRAWAEVYGQGVDLAGLNKLLVEQKRRTISGMLGNLDLLTGSAVIDFGNNTMYLRLAKETVGPELAGKWVAVRYEFDGRRGRYNPGDAAIEFKDGRVRFTAQGSTTVWGFHMRDEADRYRVGLFEPRADELADGFGYSSNGILKLAGGTLTLVIERGNKNPTEFAAPKGSGLLLIEYERAK